MEFELGIAEELGVSDSELSDLLTQVYVDEGFTEPELAKTLFDPTAVRQRGVLISLRERHTRELAGMVILVPPESKARRLGTGNAIEMQLLAVKSNHRGRGLGRRLAEHVIAMAIEGGRSDIILWTQSSMLAAQQLYRSLGFAHVNDIESEGRKFLVFARSL